MPKRSVLEQKARQDAARQCGVPLEDLATTELTLPALREIASQKKWWMEKQMKSSRRPLEWKKWLKKFRTRLNGAIANASRLALERASEVYPSVKADWAVSYMRDNIARQFMSRRKKRLRITDALWTEIGGQVVFGRSRQAFLVLSHTNTEVRGISLEFKEVKEGYKLQWDFYNAWHRLSPADQKTVRKIKDGYEICARVMNGPLHWIPSIRRFFVERDADSRLRFLSIQDKTLGDRRSDHYRIHAHLIASNSEIISERWEADHGL